MTDADPRPLALALLADNQRCCDLTDVQPCPVSDDTEPDATTFFAPRGLDVHTAWWADNDPMNNTFDARS